jgi:hypothetical protein
MQYFMIHDETADGGYPFDSDLHNMTDDGCPLIPDPSRWTDPDWKDNLGEMDTFDASPVEPEGRVEPEAGQSSLPIDSPRSRMLRCRHCGNTVAHSPENLLKYARSGYAECCGRPMGYFALQTAAETVPVHSAAA